MTLEESMVPPHTGVLLSNCTMLHVVSMQNKAPSHTNTLFWSACCPTPGAPLWDGELQGLHVQGLHDLHSLFLTRCTAGVLLSHIHLMSKLIQCWKLTA